ncbi:hypothetical protein NCC78_11105 [Micromonospora phytophila]|uniref:hypothetical protein n=1 Tax=Micromonospora phytophila TaxID=709888 RepID=UPI00202EAA88|nr:hypothetical protein [Micromonospora phytophila]MCM0675231.1 hypothetical protein [Micromonospora phytophila]
MTSAADGEQHDAAVARSSPTRGRGHWAWPWVLLILALPGAGRVALCGASTLVLWTYGHLRTAPGQSSRHADH